jgi:EAL domain-containing protein (putative c-di-GMP-specific phosphodiesterase class I)
VIEDDEIARAALVRQLQQLGPALIEESSDGRHARLCLERSAVPFDLVCCDLMLPGADGVELLRDLCGRQAPGGVLLVSAMEESVLRSVAVSCRERGVPVLGALRKPVRREALSRLLGDRLAPRSAFAPVPVPRSRDTRRDEIERAFEQRTIGAEVQPVVDARDGRLLAVELFAHWRRADGSALSGARLLRVLENAGLGDRLGRYMVGVALRMAAEWRSQGLHVPVSVNVDDAALSDLAFPEFVGQLLRATDVSGEQLIVEVGEGVALDHADALDVLARLRMRGVRVALDNFGKGPVSASRALRLPLTEIKIDRTFVRGLPDGVVSRAVVEFAARLATGLGVAVTAVGVETEAQRCAAAELGCAGLQGYAIARPMAPDTLSDWLRQLAAGSSSPAVTAAEPGPGSGQSR